MSIEVAQIDETDGFKNEADKNEISGLEVRLTKLENGLKESHRIIDEIMVNVKGLFRDDVSPVLLVTEKGLNSSSAVCGLTDFPSHSANIQMLSLYEDLSFSNPDGGLWKQGWPISYTASQWDQSNKLKVFVVPHSHNDPGWIKTFEKYFMDQTKHILDNMAVELGEDSRRKFIWAEISYLSRWWDKATPKAKSAVRRYLENGQLEIVSGGWVMNDEANTHFFAMLSQMIEGHEWLLNHVGVTPRNGWAIDPFGMSPTMAYLLKRMGFTSMLIQRVHYAVKKYFAKEKSLEFLWRQTWDNNATTDMFCHLMPFYSYDVPHTCGPDPKICCQFDFKRLPGGRINCPWRVPPQPITETNVDSRAQLLLDQYRKKAQLFRTNVLLVPLGDDFRYDKATEWDQQFNNYQLLFDYMNAKQEWNVVAQFGTLQDYFHALLQGEQNEKNPSGSSLQRFPSVSGDFFTYADRDDHYWSGYFTTRPFYKKMDRVLEAHLRGADILFSLVAAHLNQKGIDSTIAIRPYLKRLVEARRNLGLFQHHDGITGTAKDVVVVDYANRMLQSVEGLQQVIAWSLQYLQLNSSVDLQMPIIYTMDESRSSYSTIPEKLVIKLPPHSTRYAVLYNSLERRRQELVSLHVSSPYACIRDFEGKIVPHQVSPVWLKDGMAGNQYQVSFIEDIQALGFASYTLQAVSKADMKSCKISVPSISMYNSEWQTQPAEPFIQVEEGTPSEFILSNMNVEAVFHPTGLLKALKLKNDGITLNTELQFLKYGVRSAKDKSGGYLFLPDKEAQPIPVENPIVYIIKGSLLSEVHVFLPNVLHKIQIKTSPGTDGLGIDVNNIVDITPESNREIVMRVISDIANAQRYFFTDLNGFQVLRRKTFSKLPLQANFYPMASVAYLEDSETRFSILSAQPLGVASLEQGWLEVMMDRKLNQDDNRGLEQGITDNVRTPSSFRFLLEKREAVAKLPNPSGFLSLAGHQALQSLLHPTFSMVMLDNATGPSLIAMNKQYSALLHDLPCDVHLVMLRASLLENETQFALNNSSMLILQRLGYDCHLSHPGFFCDSTSGQMSIGNMFPHLFSEEVTQMSLSGLYDGQVLKKSQQFQLDPMELYAFRLAR